MLPRLAIPAAVLLILAACGEPERTKDKPAQPVPAAPAATIAAGTAAPSAAPSTAPIAARPADAVEFKGHWYQVVAFKGSTSWHQAKEACEKAGGHLAIIETAEEQTFIAKLLGGKYAFLGATNEKKATADNFGDETWTWVDGKPFKYTSWMSGQPNNYGGSENFLATYDGGDWVDVAVEGDSYWMPTCYLCEWDY